jgi:hypothetical protein
VRVAFVAAGPTNLPHAIWLGTRGPDGAVEVTGTPITVADVAYALAPTVVTDLGGPDLHRVGERVDLVLGYETEGGRWSLARVEDVLGERRIQPIDVGPGSFDDPEWLSESALLARERLTGGGSRIVLLDTSRRSDIATPAATLCATESACPTERTDTFVHRPSSDPLAFDRDEVRAPAVVEVGGVRRIYYAGRRGTRWGIGVLIAGPDGRYFRVANEGRPVLTAGEGPFDALGVAGPAPYVDGDSLTLLHAGTDGARWRLLSASQPIRGL